jgi:hypothetical protein
LIDIPIILVGATAGLLRTYLANHHVTQRCPCSLDEINGFDRGIVGNHSDVAGRHRSSTCSSSVPTARSPRISRWPPKP